MMDTFTWIKDIITNNLSRMFGTGERMTDSGEIILFKRGYSLVRKLGEGGYAKVYLAEFRSKTTSSHSVQLACKVIDVEETPKKFLTKFLPRELNIISKVTHPHIISILSIYQRRKNFYIFMRYAENGDLLDYIIKNGAVSEDQARTWTRQIALGLQYLHILEIAHRDIKCENILITKHLNCKIADFGFARSVVTDPRLPRELSNTFCGSVSYAPPEIIHGESYNPKIADIWSFGVLIYTILNKSNPFETKNLKVLYESQIRKRWRIRTKYENKLSKEIKTLLGEMMEPDIHNRILIENVLNSAWIAMNPKLRTLNNAEYNSLQSAMEDIKSAGVNTERRDSGDDDPNSYLLKIRSNQNSLTVFKEEQSGLNLQLTQSDNGTDVKGGV